MQTIYFKYEQNPDTDGKTQVAHRATIIEYRYGGTQNGQHLYYRKHVTVIDLTDDGFRRMTQNSTNIGLKPVNPEDHPDFKLLTGDDAHKVYVLLNDMYRESLKYDAMIPYMQHLSERI